MIAGLGLAVTVDVFGPRRRTWNGRRSPRGRRRVGHFGARRSTRRPGSRPRRSGRCPAHAGCFGKPGIVRISPVSGTRKPAPAAMRTSRTVMSKSRGRPTRFSSSDSERWVLAMQIGTSPKPSLHRAVELRLRRDREVHVGRAVDRRARSCGSSRRADRSSS